jgi:TonB family protein
VDVTDVIRFRMQQPAGLQRMVAVSTLAHAAVVAILVLAPGQWLGRTQPAPRTVMTISLGGGVRGPDNGGLTSVSGRAIQTVSAEPLKRPDQFAAPAAKTPEMTIPKPDAKPLRNTTAPVKQGPDNARGRTPTKGDEPTPGSAVAETGVRGLGFGLSTGGGAGAGSRLDVSDFCCPEYILLMVERIRSNWRSQVDATGLTVVNFTIQRDGRLTAVTTERSSGYGTLDNNATRAVILTGRLPELPSGYSNPTLGVHLSFEYTLR